MTSRGTPGSGGGVPARIGVGTLVLCALVALGLASSGRAQIVPPLEGEVSCPDGRSDPAVKAANGLLALPWRGLGRQYATDAEEMLGAKLGLRDLDGTRLASMGGRTNGFRYRFSLTADNPRIDLDVRKPPGFRAVQKDCLSLRAPLEGDWGANFRMKVKGRARVSLAGETVARWSRDMNVSLRVTNAFLSAALRMDDSDSDRPRFRKGTVVGALRIGTSGPLPLRVSLLRLRGEMRPAGLTLVTKLNKVGVDLPGFGEASVTGDLLSTLGPPEQVGDFAFQIVSFSVRAKITVGLARVGKQSTALTIPLRAVVIPVWEDVANVLGPLRDGLPLTWGEGPVPVSETPKVPPADYDFGGKALEIERAIGARHLFNGTVLSRSVKPRPRIPTPQGSPANSTQPTVPTQVALPALPKLSVELDSAIWTGHYLTAEAFRYAVTRDAAALVRLKEVLRGVERLFDVTTGVVVHDAKRTKVTQGPGILSRTVLTDTEGKQLAEKSLKKYKCYYEWQHARGKYLYGLGCGDAHPVSRDQYTGVMMGLAFAHFLVDDPDVKRRTKERIETALDYLRTNDWNIRLPPDGRIYTTFLGNIDRMLAFLRIGASVNPAKYGPEYDRYKAAAALNWLPVWFSSFDPLLKYYKFNLSHGGFAPALFLETDSGARSDWRRSYASVWRTVGTHRNAYFEVLRILMLGGDTAMSRSELNVNLSLTDELRAVLAEWIERRDDPDAVSPEEPALGMERLAKPEYQIALSAAGRLGRYRTLVGGVRCLSKFPMSVAGRIGHGMDFAWQRDPFETDVEEDKCGRKGLKTSDLKRRSSNMEFPGVDYLLPYWIGAYLNVLPRPPAS